MGKQSKTKHARRMAKQIIAELNLYPEHLKRVTKDVRDGTNKLPELLNDQYQ